MQHQANWIGITYSFASRGWETAVLSVSGKPLIETYCRRTCDGRNARMNRPGLLTDVLDDSS